MIVVSAGMHRSASTFFYNALRLMLEEVDPEVVCGWCGVLGARMYADPKLLVKIHRPDPALVKRADVIIYSYRDPRDALTSFHRLKGVPFTMARVDRWVEDDRWWRARATHLIRYEDFMDQPINILRTLAGSVGYKGDLEEIFTRTSAIFDENLSKHLEEEVKEAQEAKSGSLIRHFQHRTSDGTQGHDDIPPKLLKRIDQAHKGWLSENGYAI